MKALPPADEALLRDRIRDTARELDAAVRDLVGAAEARTTLRRYVERYPLQLLGGAFLFGAWLGLRAATGATRARR